jgi:glycerol-3-phosphate cytidylyltransferase
MERVIGFTAGVFDMLHKGHINLLLRASKLCDTLIVGVATDELCVTYKNKHPFINEDDRKLLVESIKGVDMVVLQDTVDKRVMWKKLKFDVLIVGDDWFDSPTWNEYETFIEEKGGQIKYISRTPNVSSTLMRTRYVSPVRTKILFIDIDHTIWPFNSNDCCSDVIFPEAFDILRRCPIPYYFCSRSKYWNEWVCQAIMHHEVTITDPSEHAVFYNTFKKVPNIMLLLQVHHLFHENVVLLDDDPLNCESGEELGIGTVQVDRQVGLLWTDICKAMTL